MSGEIPSPKVAGEQDPETFKSVSTNMEPEVQPQTETKEQKPGLMVKILENKAVIKGILIAGAFGTMIGGVKSAEASGNPAIEMMKLRDGVNQHVIASTLRYMNPESVKTVDGKEIIEGEVPLDESLVSFYRTSPTNLKSLGSDHKKEAISHWESFKKAAAKDPQMKAIIDGGVGAIADDFLAQKVDEEHTFSNATVSNLVDRVKSMVLKVHGLAKTNKTEEMSKVENTLLEIAKDETAAAAQADNSDAEQVAQQ